MDVFCSLSDCCTSVCFESALTRLTHSSFDQASSPSVCHQSNFHNILHHQNVLHDSTRHRDSCDATCRMTLSRASLFAPLENPGLKHEIVCFWYPWLRRAVLDRCPSPVCNAWPNFTHITRREVTHRTHGTNTVNATLHQRSTHVCASNPFDSFTDRLSRLSSPSPCVRAATNTRLGEPLEVGPSQSEVRSHQQMRKLKWQDRRVFRHHHLPCVGTCSSTQLLVLFSSCFRQRRERCSSKWTGSLYASTQSRWLHVRCCCGRFGH